MSSNYDGCYVKLADDAAFWLVENGERRPVGREDFAALGLKPVVVVSADVLGGIPVEGSKPKRTYTKSRGEDLPEADGGEKDEIEDGDEE